VRFISKDMAEHTKIFAVVDNQITMKDNIKENAKEYIKNNNTIITTTIEKVPGNLKQNLGDLYNSSFFPISISSDYILNEIKNYIEKEKNEKKEFDEINCGNAIDEIMAKFKNMINEKLTNLVRKTEKEYYEEKMNNERLKVLNDYMTNNYV
jgi:hypothetical protein